MTAGLWNCYFKAACLEENYLHKPYVLR